MTTHSLWNCVHLLYIADIVNIHNRSGERIRKILISLGQSGTHSPQYLVIPCWRSRRATIVTGTLFWSSSQCFEKTGNDT